MSEKSSLIAQMPGSSSPGAGAGFVPELPRRTYTFPGLSDSSSGEEGGATLTDNCLAVGRGVEIVGTIEKCEKLLVEGTIRADLEQCQALELSESGVYVGKVVTDIAIIDGSFDGVLIARQHLKITPTARIKGRIEFGTIEVQSGAEIDGELRRLSLEAVEIDTDTC